MESFFIDGHFYPFDFLAGFGGGGGGTTFSAFFGCAGSFNGSGGGGGGTSAITTTGGFGGGGGGTNFPFLFCPMAAALIRTANGSTNNFFFINVVLC